MFRYGKAKWFNKDTLFQCRDCGGIGMVDGTDCPICSGCRAELDAEDYARFNPIAYGRSAGSHDEGPYLLPMTEKCAVGGGAIADVIGRQIAILLKHGMFLRAHELLTTIEKEMEDTNES